MRVARLAGVAGGKVIDAQWDSPFLRSLGATPVARKQYLALLDRSAAQPVPLPCEALTRALAIAARAA